MTRTRTVLVVGLLVALVLASVVSFYASGHPDGLSHVAQQLGITAAERPRAAPDSPFAGYATRGVGNDRLSGGLAGVVGVLLVGALTGGVAWAARRRRSAPSDRAED